MKTLKYLFWKLLICLLTEIPAFAVTALIAQIGKLPLPVDGESLPLALAALGGGLLCYFAAMGGIMQRLKLGDLRCGRFVLLESGAYALFLLLGCLAALPPVRGILFPFFQPHALLTLCLGRGFIGLNIPVYAVFCFCMYRRNRRLAAKRAVTAVGGAD